VTGSWLDRLAVTAVREDGREGGRDRRPATDEGLSREAAVRLGFAGLASLSLGLWRAAPGSADNPGLTPEASKCFAGCAINWQKNHDANNALCDDFFGRTLAEGKGGWEKLKIALPFPGVALAKTVLKGYCYGFADQRARGKWRDCNDECVVECAKGRKPQSSTAAHQACEPAPQPRPYTPALPPAPRPEDDPCWACQDCCSPLLCCAPIIDGVICQCAEDCKAFGCQ